jgi:hypothetical protein
MWRQQWITRLKQIRPATRASPEQALRAMNIELAMGSAFPLLGEVRSGKQDRGCRLRHELGLSSRLELIENVALAAIGTF